MMWVAVSVFDIKKDNDNNGSLSFFISFAILNRYICISFSKLRLLIL